MKNTICEKDQDILNGTGLSTQHYVIHVTLIMIIL